jgi:hypothetical protein
MLNAAGHGTELRRATDTQKSALEAAKAILPFISLKPVLIQ